MDTGDALAGSRTRLFDSGSIASPGTGWRIIADPALTVTQGQQLDLVVEADNATLTLGRYAGIGSGHPSLPAGFWPAAGGASPKMTWTNSPGSFTIPATILEANCGVTSSIFFIMARVA
jgi:hypothetical protein